MTVDIVPTAGVVESVHDPWSETARWVQAARDLEPIARHVAASTLVPKAYQGKSLDVLACWLTGQELGIPRMASLRSIDVIQGTPSLRAHAMRALVQSHGHEVEIVESTDQRCVMRGRRKGAQNWQQVEWDLNRAKGLGLLSKDQWKAQPRTMLIARATGEICRLIASDKLFGIPYTSEELADMDEPIRVTANTGPTRSAVVADLLEGQPEPAAELAAPAVSGSPIDAGDEALWPETAQPAGAAS
jgi:hypothetical protein